MIYLNHAATSFPKPPEVIQAVSGCLRALPREGRRSTLDGEDELHSCRLLLARLFNAPDAERIYFTSGATEAFNLIVRGLPLRNKRVLVILTEHSALLRPLYALLPPDSIDLVHADRNGFVSPQSVAGAITEDTACVFVNHCSNVTGAAQDLAGIGRAAKSRGALFAVDAAQSAGVFPIDICGMGIDLLVFTGHKALLGPPGTGGFYVGKDVPLSPVSFGGTGTEGDRVIPLAADLFEVGTPNTPGIAGLCAGVRLVLETDIEESARNTERRMTALRRELERLTNVCVYGGVVPCGSALAFNIGGLSPADVGYILQSAYGIVVRSGHHCAPLLGEDIGAPGGSVRVSISPHTTQEELHELLEAVRDIAGSTAEAGL